MHQASRPGHNAGIKVSQLIQSLYAQKLALRQRFLIFGIVHGIRDLDGRFQICDSIWHTGRVCLVKVNDLRQFFPYGVRTA